MLKPFFWTCLGLIGWTYLAYPVGMLALARVRPRRAASTPAPADVPAPALVGAARDPADDWPAVSVVLAVRDGAAMLNGRLDNLLAQEYPADRLDVIVVCNGSRDGTEMLAAERAAGEARVTALTSPAAEGKAGALNRGVATAHGDVIVFADVRQRFEPDAVRRLVAALRAPGVGAVTGRLVVGESRHPGVEGFNRYWELETLLRQAESETGSVVGATGAIYAVWRAAYRAVPPGTLLDDVHIPVRIALDGGRVVMEPRAVARDTPTRSAGREYLRRVRTLAGNLQLVSLMPALLRPGNPLFVRFLSHKLLRVLSPIFFLGVLGSGLAIGQGVYLAVALALAALYAAGLLGLVLPVRALAIPAAFVLVHVAAVVALVRRRRAAELWAR